VFKQVGTGSLQFIECHNSYEAVLGKRKFLSVQFENGYALGSFV